MPSAPFVDILSNEASCLVGSTSLSVLTHSSWSGKLYNVHRFSPRMTPIQSLLTALLPVMTHLTTGYPGGYRVRPHTLCRWHGHGGMYEHHNGNSHCRIPIL